MSRQLRKAQELVTDTHQQEHESESSEEDDEPVKPKAMNMFDLLMGGDGEDDHEEDDDSDEGGSDKMKEMPVAEKEVTSSNKSKKKKKKKKGKGKDVKEQVEKDEEMEFLNQEIEKLGGPDANKRSTSGFKDVVSTCLAVNPKLLDPEAELIKIFGAKTVNAQRKQQGSTSRGGPSGQHQKRTLKKSVLVHAKDHWPRPDGGIIMEPAKAPAHDQGSRYYQFNYSSQYGKTQKQFEQVQRTHDPNMIAGLLRHHPFHVDALSQLSEVYKQMGEMETAADMLERALYNLEQGFHSTFDFGGHCRMDYKGSKGNLSLFVTVFRHVQHVGRRGCHKTALEYSKFLLSLDPVRDPMGMLFTIDYYALRGENYTFPFLLKEKYETEFGQRVLNLALPNFAFSMALCKHRLDQSNVKLEPALVAVMDKHPDGDTMLQTSLLLFPMALPRLLERASIKMSIRHPGVMTWEQIVAHPVFSPENWGEVSASLDHLVSLFVERHYAVWRDDITIAWLKKNAEAAILEYQQSDSLAKSLRMARETEHPPTQENFFKRFNVADFSDQIVTLPADEGAPAGANAAGLGQFGGGVGGEYVVGMPDMTQGTVPMPEDAGTVRMFLESLLPWNVYRRNNEDAADDEDY